MKLSLYARGILLIAVPLFFGVAISICFFVIQDYNDKKVAKESKMQEIIFRVNNIYTSCIEIVCKRVASRLFSTREYSEQEANKHMALVSKEYKILRKLVTQKSELANLKGIQRNATALLDAASSFTPVSEDLGQLEKLQRVQSNWMRLKSLYGPMFELGHSYNIFVKDEHFRDYGLLEEVRTFDAGIRYYLLLALAGSVFLSGLLFFIFMKSIYEGIGRLNLNTELFRAGAKLSPPLESGDEIAQVDSVFHKMVEDIREAQRIKQEVLAVVSHDLRSPLTAINGYLSLVSMGAFGELSEQKREATIKQEKRLAVMLNLINEILDLEKIDAKKFELSRRMIYVETVFDDGIAATRAQASAKQIEIEPCECLLEVYADPLRIKQIFFKLLSALVQHSNPGARLRFFASESEGNTVIVMQSSDAPISRELREELFSRYRSVAVVEEQVEYERLLGQLTPLSLPLADELVKLHGGRLVSEIDHSNLAFRLSFPLPGTT